MTERIGLIEQFGGKCSRCGYNKCHRALDFHHTIKREGRSGRVDLREVTDYPERFLLVCANCHREIHDDIDRVNRTYETCKSCGSVFHAKHRYGTNRENRGQFCSKQCHQKYRSTFARTNDSVLARIGSYCAIDAETECWNWTGTVYRTSPVVVVPHGEAWQARSVRQVLFEIHNTGIKAPKRLYATCRNYLCVNPEHTTTSRQRY